MKIKFIAREVPAEPRIVLKLITRDDYIFDLIKSLPGVTEINRIEDKYLITLLFEKGRTKLKCVVESVIKKHTNGFTMEGIGDVCRFILTILIGAKAGNTLLSLKIIYDGKAESIAKQYLDRMVEYISSYITDTAGKQKEVIEAEKAQKFFWTEYILMKLTDSLNLPKKSELLRRSPLEDLGGGFGKLITYSNNYSCEKILNKIRSGSLNPNYNYYIVCLDKDYRVKIRILVEKNVITGIAALIEGLWFLGEYAAKILVENINKLPRVRVWIIENLPQYYVSTIEGTG